MNVARAIGRYHELLTDELAAETQAALDARLGEQGLFFGDRPLCSVLRPRFIPARRWDELQRSCTLLLSAFARAQQAALASADVRSQFGLTTWEEQLVHHEPGFRASSPTSRLDAFMTATGPELLFTEYNAETPAGPAYSDALSQLFLGLPAMGAFLREYAVRPLPARHGVLHPMLDAFRQWSGHRDPPRIAILDWHEVPTYSEFVLFDRYFRGMGISSRIVDPRAVEYANGKLVHGDFHITLIYKRVLLNELVEREGIEHPVIRAVRDGAVCMVNPFRCKLLHKKASLAVLSDERNARLFTAEQLDTIGRHIPWTRTVAERRTQHRGASIDLVPWVKENRDHLVLKPNDEYGGKGIVLGWEVSQSAWENALRAALAEPTIVQERITLPTEPYPGIVNGTLEIMDRMLDTAPFVSYGEHVQGCMTRLGTVPLLNVTAGGGSTVPTFVVEDRK